jgi:AcrR family transcriptional regulator
MRRTQEDRSNSTKSALVSAARELFGERGYTAVPAADIVRAAGVSRGALYHHFGDKQGLFRAVLESLEHEVTAEVAAAMADAPDFGTTMVVALRAFLDACGRAEVRQISLTDAPAVLGWAAWREIEAQHGLALITSGFEQAVEEGLLPPQPVEVLAQLVLSAVIEGALLIAAAEDPVAARANTEQVLAAWFLGLGSRYPGQGFFPE